MSLLNQLFNRGVFGAKCKTCLTLGISRMKLLQNKRDLKLKHMPKEIAQFLQAGQEPIARIRVEHVIREQNICAAYAVLEMFCEFVLARVPILESQKECPSEMREAIASIIFAAPRCSDLPDLIQMKNLFSAKYGKEFVAAVSELRPDSSVNRTIIEKLSVNAPTPETKLKVLKDIAQEYNLDWDSSKTEAELCKKHEDLLGGSTEACGASLAQTPDKQASLKAAASNGRNSTMPTETKQQHQLQAPMSQCIMPRSSSNDIEQSSKSFNTDPVSGTSRETTSQSSDALEKARAAIAAAERATAAACAAAQLVNVNFGSLKIEEGKSS